MKKINLPALVKLCRPKHWIKNFLVFAPLVFSGKLSDPTFFIIILAGWFAFNFLASAIYVFNDLCDLKTDRLHEIKKKRPLASGAVSPLSASVLLFLLIVSSFTLNAAVCSGINAAGMLAVYLILNVIYSLWAKKIALLDIAILVFGFLLRIYYGAFLIDAPVSAWMYLTITTMAAYLGFGKRRNELMKRICEGREIDDVLKNYSESFLDKNMYMCLTLTNAFYALWTVFPVPVLSAENDNRITSVPLVLLICMRYSLLIESKTYADPVDVLTSDRILIFLVLLYGVYMMFLMYGNILF